MLAEKLITNGSDFAEAWNFGPEEADSKSVSWVINHLIQKIPNVEWEIDKTEKPHEASLLLLDSSKAKAKLSWQPRWSLETALDKVIEWNQAWKENKIMAEVSISQIQSYNNS